MKTLLSLVLLLAIAAAAEAQVSGHRTRIGNRDFTYWSDGSYSTSTRLGNSTFYHYQPPVTYRYTPPATYRYRATPTYRYQAPARRTYGHWPLGRQWGW